MKCCGNRVEREDPVRNRTEGSERPGRSNDPPPELLGGLGRKRCELLDRRDGPTGRPPGRRRYARSFAGASHHSRSEAGCARRGGTSRPIVSGRQAGRASPLPYRIRLRDTNVVETHASETVTPRSRAVSARPAETELNRSVSVWTGTPGNSAATRLRSGRAKDEPPVRKSAPIWSRATPAASRTRVSAPSTRESSSEMKDSNSS